MPYDISTKDGITIRDIPDDVPADHPDLKARVASLRQQLNPAPTERQQYLSNPAVRLAKGGMDSVTGAAQLLQKGLSGAEHLAGDSDVTGSINRGADTAGQWLNTHVFNKLGLPGNFAGEVLGVRGMTPDQMREDIHGSEEQYQAARKATAPVNPGTGEHEPGFDLARLGGSIVNPVSMTVGRALPALRMAAPVRELATRGAIGGAVGGALQPTDSENFAIAKAGQVGLGAGAGALLGPVATRVGGSLMQRPDEWVKAIAGLGGMAPKWGAAAQSVVQRWMGNRGADVTPERVQQLLRQQLEADGIDLATLQPQVFESLANDVRAALQQGKQLDPAALLRAKDFEALNLPYSQGQVTRQPGQWQREFNLAGVEGVGEPLQGLFSQQGRSISRRMGQAAAGAGERFDEGGKLIDLARGAQQVRDRNVSAAYRAFRDATGRELEVPLQGLAQDYARTLETFGETIPGAVRRQFEGLGLMGGTQRRGLSIQQAEQLIKTINANTDPSNRVSSRALGELRSSVQRAITDVADGDAEGAMAAQLAHEARGFAAENFRNQAATPGLRAAIDSMEPDHFVQRFVIDGKVNEIGRLVEAVGPEGQEIMRRQFADHLMNKAFGANAAGDGKAAQATFNRELVKIGRPKLVALLGEDGADEMLRIGRVLAYIKQVPEGATPNVSGTSQALANIVGRKGGVSGLPYINDYVVKPLGKYMDRREVAAALQGLQGKPTEIDAETIRKLAPLFPALPFAGGAAAGQSVR